MTDLSFISVNYVKQAFIEIINTEYYIKNENIKNFNMTNY